MISSAPAALLSSSLGARSFAVLVPEPHPEAVDHHVPNRLLFARDEAPVALI
jgi:hypothetical protein